MDFKLKFTLDGIRHMIPDIVRSFQKSAPPLVKEQVVKEIKAGKSPVEGQGRFQKYSDSYDAAIRSGQYKQYGKRSRPVNLFLSGKLIGSYTSRSTPGGITVGFKHKLFDIHNRQGAGKSHVVRRMLPTENGEIFSRTITQKIMKMLTTDIIRTVVSNQNR